MNILGIETSCDETSAAIVADGNKVYSNIIASQIDIHARTGGVVPEVAAREHLKAMPYVIDECFEKAKMTWDDIHGIAVTKGPGLIGSLLTGLSSAKALVLVTGKPLIGVNHIEGHIYANWLGSESVNKHSFPILVLTVSGGHNELILMRDHGDYQLIGETIDDAAGEAFDKVARLLNLGFPGGPIISKCAKEGNVEAYKFPRAWLMDEGGTRPKEITNFNFSFSGLKTAVRRTLLEILGEESHGLVHEGNKNLPEKILQDIAASFEESVVDVLSAKAIAAAKKFGVKEIYLAGGVSANMRLRSKMSELSEINHFKLFYPKDLKYCTDNAAMIACAGYYHISKGERDDFLTLDVEPGLRLVKK